MVFLVHDRSVDELAHEIDTTFDALVRRGG